VVLTTRPTKHPKVLLMAHMDVVPGPPELFELRQADGRLYGRGVFDMKLALAVYMKLLLELGDRLPAYDLGLMITSDEELGGRNGAQQLVREGWRADVAINPDASSGWDLERVAKGMAYYRFDSHGTAGHGSRPWAYRNAIVQLMAFLQELNGHFPTEPCGSSSHAHDTMTIGTIQGGAAHNQVPDFATAEVDIRLMPGASPLDIAGLVRSTAAHYDGITVATETVEPAFENDPEHEYMRLAAHLITRTTGRKPRLVLSHGASDSRYFAGLGMPFIMTRPQGGEQHGPGEWLEASGPEAMYRFVSAFVEQVARTK
jgi:acetylornithine deacetylase/succinyl-diaminopimelate desuccinylase-like protein